MLALDSRPGYLKLSLKYCDNFNFEFLSETQLFIISSHFVAKWLFQQLKN